MSTSIAVRDISAVGRHVESRTIADVAAFAESGSCEWIAIAPVSKGAAELPAGQLANLTADAVLPASTDPRTWFWNNAAPPTIAALGLPRGTIALRRAACGNLPAIDGGAESAADLLWALAARGCSFAAPGAPGLDRCEFTEHSAIPAEDRTRGGGWLLRALAGVRAATTVQAGVLLVNDFLDASHQRSQSIEGDADGDYWHGIMHRREPDFGNAKYWFRRVGDHPVFASLADVARGIAAGFESSDVADWLATITNGGWDAFAAVDLSEAAHCNPSTAVHDFAERLLWAEMILLLAHCCRNSA